MHSPAARQFGRVSRVPRSPGAGLPVLLLALMLGLLLVACLLFGGCLNTVNEMTVEKGGAPITVTVTFPAAAGDVAGVLPDLPALVWIDQLRQATAGESKSDLDAEARAVVNSPSGDAGGSGGSK